MDRQAHEPVLSHDYHMPEDDGHELPQILSDGKITANEFLIKSQPELPLPKPQSIPIELQGFSLEDDDDEVQVAHPTQPEVVAVSKPDEPVVSENSEGSWKVNLLDL